MWSDIDPAEERIDPQNESGLLTSAASILRGSILLPLDWFQLFTAVWQKTVQQSDWIFSESQIVKGLKFEEKMYFFAVLVLLGTELRTVSSGKSHFSYTSVSQSQRWTCDVFTIQIPGIHKSPSEESLVICMCSLIVKWKMSFVASSA